MNQSLRNQGGVAAQRGFGTGMSDAIAQRAGNLHRCSQEVAEKYWSHRSCPTTCPLLAQDPGPLEADTGLKWADHDTRLGRCNNTGRAEPLTSLGNISSQENS